MSSTVNPAPSRVNRRALLTTGAVGATAVVGSIALSPKAEAAAGQAVLAGRSNSAGSASTSLTSTSTTPTVQVRNTGAGAAAFFFAQNSNGFAGGTGSGSKYGLSAANSGAAGSGAGLAASGGNNSGILVNTTNPERAAIRAMNAAATGGSAGAGVVGIGGANVGVVASSDDLVVPAVLSFGDATVVDGFLSVFRNDVSELTFGLTAPVANVVFTGTAVLDGAGAGTVALTEAAAATDLDTATVIVTPNSGSMPNLFASVAAGELSIAGGTAAGTVSWQVSAARNDFLFGAPAKAGRATGTTSTRVARLKGLAKPS